MIESMFMVGQRTVPWAKVGVSVEGAVSSREAIEKAGLNWKVEPRKIFIDGVDGEAKEYVANVRSKDNKVLGVVSKRYKIVQNEDAFAFTDELLANDVKFEAAGAFADGKKVWLLARMPDFKLVGDDMKNYLVFTNTHNGTGSVRVCVTPVRVVCNNVLNLAFRSASRAWSARHIGENPVERIHEAQSALDLTQAYIKGLDAEATRLAMLKVTPEQIEKALKVSVPQIRKAYLPDATQAALERAEIIRGDFMRCYNSPDLDNFRGTAWGAVNAMSDFITHGAPGRNSKKFDENRCSKIFDGHADFDNFVKFFKAA